jgi:glycosyltransferase involved in cell wall biosynthesis
MLAFRSLERRRRSSLLVRALLPFFYPLADAVIGVSDALTTELAQHVPRAAGRVMTIHNGVRLEAAEGTGFVHPWLAPREEPVVLAVGRLVDEKDFPTLLRGMKLLLERRDARLVVLGEGVRRAELEQLTRDLGIQQAVALPGHVDDVAAHMRAASVLAMTSVCEGFPNVLIEALAAGLPVVSTNCPGGPREILADGEFGTLVPVANPEALASALETVLAEQPQDREPLRQRAAEYSVERVADRYLNLIDELSARR